MSFVRTSPSSCARLSDAAESEITMAE
jgi:hypothetical protein